MNGQLKLIFHNYFLDSNFVAKERKKTKRQKKPKKVEQKSNENMGCSESREMSVQSPRIPSVRRREGLGPEFHHFPSKFSEISPNF